MKYDYQIGKNPCEKCRAEGRDEKGENFYWYGEDEGGHCFSSQCGFTIPSKEYVENGYCSKSGYKNVGGNKGVTVSNRDIAKLKEKRLSEDEIAEIYRNTVSRPPNSYRGLDYDIAESLGVRWEISNGQVSKMYFPATIVEDGTYKTTGFKIREYPKTFYSKGYVGKCNLMEGQTHAVAETLVIVGGECFTEDTEVLTDSGFVKFSEVTSESLVLQVDENKCGEFVKPLALIKKHYDGDLVGVKTSYTHTLTTPNHNLVFESSKNGVFKQKASEKISKGWFVPKSVNVNGKGTGLTKKQLQLVIAVCADGSIRNRKNSNNAVHFGLMKKRKIERLTGVLNDLQISHSSYINTHSSGKQYTTFNFTLPDYVDDKNLRNDWLVSATIDERLFILDELKHWDGYSVKDRNSIEFSTKNFDDASFIQELAHTCGYYASIKHKSNELGEWYKVLISFTGFKATTQRFEKYSKYHNGYVYCVTVPTGMIVIRHEGKVSICGNCDLISAKQMLQRVEKKYNRQINVVSSLLGEDSTAEMLKANIDWVEKHKKIVLALDNDDAGLASIQKCIDILPKDKLFTANLRHKDPNEYIKQNDIESFLQDAYWNVSPVEDYGIIGSGDLFEYGIEAASDEGIPVPFHMYDLKPYVPMFMYDSITLLVGSTSIGKTANLDSTTESIVMSSKGNVGILSLEASRKKFAQKTASRIIGTPLNRLSKEEQIELQMKYKDKIMKYYLNEQGEHRFYFADSDFDTIEEAEKCIIRLIKINGCKVIVLDPLQNIIGNKTNEEQRSFMLFLEKIKKRYGVLILIGTHTRKATSGEKSGSDGGVQKEDSIEGSGSISKSASLIITLSRNKNAEDWIERNTTYYSVPKNRDFELTGELVARSFYRSSCSRLYPYSYAEERNFFRDDKFGDIIEDDEGFFFSSDDFEALKDHSEVKEIINDMKKSESNDTEEDELPDW